MSYTTYNTEALVVGSYASNTADKSYLLFTKHAGLLYATARSVREERSLQRYALQDFSRVNVSLVKGKGGWRIGSVEAKENFFMQAASRAARGSVVKLVKILRRYVHGEEAEPLLYQEFLEALALLSKTDIEERSAFETCAIVRLLSVLGYVAPNRDLTPLCVVPLATLRSTEVAAASPLLLSAYTAAQSVSHLEG